VAAIESIDFDAGSLERLSGPWWERSRLTALIAWRNLVHDKVRLIVTLVGIAFSTILMGIQLGMLLNFMQTTSTIVDTAGADIWIVARGVPSVDLATPIEERRRFQALAVPGVTKAESYFLHFAFWKRDDGVHTSVIVVGVEPTAKMGLPRAMVGGQDVRDALSSPDGVVIDRLYAEKLGVTTINQLVEINHRRMRVVGFTEGIRTFTQAPYVFMSLRNARILLSQGDIERPALNEITYVLVRVADGYAPTTIQAELSSRMPDVDVLLSSVFSRKSEYYWLFTTGAGVTVISSSVLALLVGVVIVAQTLYASTMDRLPEYAVIRAMGGPRSYLYKIVIQQAVIGALLGSAIGISIVVLIAYLARDMSSPPQAPFWLILSIEVITILMCIAASVVSLRKITTIDPVSVFR
jgi:putative ABC transport system permease protein